MKEERKLVICVFYSEAYNINRSIVFFFHSYVNYINATLKLIYKFLSFSSSTIFIIFSILFYIIFSSWDLFSDI